MATQSPISSSLKTKRGKISRNVEHHTKSHKKTKKTAFGSNKRKCLSKVAGDNLDDKILTFLKSKKEPQKTLFIARACGFTTSKDVNPNLYSLKKRNLVQKISNSPPMWIANTTMDISSNVSSPIKDQYQNISNKEIQKEERSRIQLMSKSVRHVTEKPIHRYGITGRSRSNSVSKLFSQSSVISHEPGVSMMLNQQKSHDDLFKSTIHDKTAPGAYNSEQLEHNHEKRTDMYNIHRHALNYPNKKSSKQHVLGIPTVSHKQTIDRGPLHMHDKNDADVGTLSIQEVQNSPRTITSSMSVVKNNEMNTPGDDSEYTDDEEYDLNFRISDVVSIRDPVVKNADVETLMQHYKFNESSLNNEQDAELNQDQEMKDDVNISDNDHEEVWVGDGFLGPTLHSKTCETKEDTEAIQKVIDANVLKAIDSIPFKSTMRSNLASALSMAQGDLQKLLDTCCKEGWIDYSPLGHIRLTEAGSNYVLDLEHSGKCSSTAQQPNRCPSLYSDQLLQNIPKRHGNTLQITDLFNSSQYSSYRIQDGPQDQTNNSVCNMSFQVNSVQDSDIRHRLMPWLPPKSQVSFSNHIADSADITSATESSSRPSFIAGELSLLPKPSVSLPTIPPIIRQYFPRDNQSGIPEKEWSAFIDRSKPNQRMISLPCSSFLPQEQLQLKRAPLLSTPDTRGSSSSPKSSPGSGKVALLPFPGQPTQQLHQQFKVSQMDTPPSLQISAESFAALNKNPISAFMEYGQCRHTTARIEVLSQRGPPHKPVFTIAAMLGSRIFPGITSSNKKDGKKDAAEQAIRILIAEGQYNMPANSSVMSIPESSMTQFDKIAALTHHKFNQLIAVIPESLVGRKVIAGLVMKMDDSDTGTVVSVGSGNRCITGDKLSLRGVTVNDCHAEIITRRGFMRFLYHQLKSYNSNMIHPLFEKSPTGKLRIKKSVTFHLYISTAPCGDGALFSPRDVESNNVALTDSCTRHRPTFETNVQGVLRTKMEGGEGTIPLDPEKHVQTWDGIVRGERLRTMSCSDKICRWNVVGIQGALLANFLDPVYLNSITLGFLFDAGHLSRAVCCRLNRGEPPLERDLFPPYHLNHPVLGRVTACDATRETQKTKSYSINWMVEDDKPEIVDGCQGTCYIGDKNESPQASRLCKKSMFHCFQQTCQILGQEKLLSVPTYYKAKRMSTEFFHAKEAMMKKFKDTNCGIWLGKPAEEEMFS